MTVYSDEPKSAVELLARYRDVKRRLYPCRAARPASLRPSTPKTSWRLPRPPQPSQPIAPANPGNARTKSPAVLALKTQDARREQRFEQSRKGPAFQSTPSSGARGSARSLPLVTRRCGASAKSQSDHFRASDSSSLAVTIRPSSTPYVAWKIVQLGIPSSAPIWPASSRSAQCGGLLSPVKTRAPYAGEVVFSRVASAAAPRLFRLARQRES